MVVRSTVGKASHNGVHAASKNDTDTTSISRRTLIRVAIAAGCGGVATVTACAQTPPTPTPVPMPRLGGSSFATQNTSVTNDLSPDGYSWAHARPLLIDKYGNQIALAQRQNSADKYHCFVFANSDGIWADSSLKERSLERGMAAYDSVNDVLHVLWKAISATDGIIYRRYIIPRNQSNAINDITKDASINLQLDRQTTGMMQYEHPNLIWLADPAFGSYGALVAAWSARNIGASGRGNEVRAAQCILGTTADTGRLAMAWAPLSAHATTTIGNLPQVAYTALEANTGPTVIYPSLARKRVGTHAGDLCLFYHDGNLLDGAGGKWRFRRIQWDRSTNNWQRGLTPSVIVAPMIEGGTDRGYTLKNQLGTTIVEDERTDHVFVGFAAWRGFRGDTWAFAQIDASDVVTLVEAYNAGGSHSYAPTGDIAFDSRHQRLIVAYCTTGSQQIRVRLYDGTKSVQEEVVAFDGQPADIPLLAEGGSIDMPERTPILTRDTVNTPTPSYRGWYGTLQWQ